MAKVYAVHDKDWAKVGQMARIISTLDKQVARELRGRMKREAIDPLAVTVRAHANGPHGARAAMSVKTRSGNKPTLVGAARGNGLATELFYGSEFGGGGRVERYIGRNATWRGEVRRDVTSQFRPFNRSGYWFTPTILDNLARVTSKVIRIANDAIERVA